MPAKGSRTTLMFSANFAQDVQAKANEYLKVNQSKLHLGLLAISILHIMHIMLIIVKAFKSGFGLSNRYLDIFWARMGHFTHEVWAT